MISDQILWPVLQAIAAAADPAPAPASAPATGAAPASDPFSIVYIMLPMLLVMWFFMIRPNQKREKERQQMLSQLSKGDRVVTTAGILGTIVGLTDKAVVLRVSEEPPVKMEFLRAAVSRVAPRDEKEKS